jgi:ATP-dependent Clp protease ATP-binding subunit ClpB
LVEAGYDPVYGARPLKRAIQKQVENAIATQILDNTFLEGDTITIDCQDGALTFSKPNDAIVSPEPEPVASVSE